jgi:hypothetical protein
MLRIALACLDLKEGLAVMLQTLLQQHYLLGDVVRSRLDLFAKGRNSMSSQAAFQSLLLAAVLSA